jgi:WD40 repeat protein
VFSPDGKTLVSAGESIIFWDVATGQTIGQPLKNHIVGVHSLDFSPDGKILASGSCKGASLGFCIQGEIVLWDVASRQPIGNPLIINGNQVDSVAFSPDGNTLATGAGGIILWELNPNAWVKSNCQRAGRNFTRDEWTQYFPGEQYRKTCNQWPLETEAMASNTSTP